MRQSKNACVFSKNGILLSALLIFSIIIGCGNDFLSGSADFYTISFNSQGGTEHTRELAQHGDNITLPTPTRDGHIFNGWFSAATGGTKYGEAEERFTVTESITMFAQWTAIPTYTITFNSQGGTGFEPITRWQGSIIILPAPTRNGYVFIGWHDAETDGEKHGEAGERFTVTESITMFAQWTAIPTYTITFDSQGGTGLEPITRWQGSIITLPTPTRDGYVFIGWHNAETDGEKYGNGGDDHKVVADITMYAYWAIAYTITFDSRGGTHINPIIAAKNSTIVLPAPTRNGYIFSGWYNAENEEERFGGGGDNYTVTYYVAMYARWTIAPINWSANSITIRNEAELRQLATLVNNGTRRFNGQTITLANNIELLDGEWLPIGNENNRFAGVFNGNNNVISGLHISGHSQNDFQGLFGVSWGTIRNLGVWVNIRGGAHIGGLVGWNYGTIENCYTFGIVVGTGERVGGLVGGNGAVSVSGTIINSYSTTTVEGFNAVGGLVGFNSNGRIENSCALGIVSGRSWVGGLVGYNGSNENNGTITNSYATGNVIGTTNSISTGGLVGFNTSGSRVNNSYASGSVTGTARRLVGSNNGSPASTTNITGSVRAVDDMKLRGTYSGWDFNSVWSFNPNINNGFPFLLALEWSY